MKSHLYSIIYLSGVGIFICFNKSRPRYLPASIGACFLFTLQISCALHTVRFCVTGRARSSFLPHSSAFTLCAQASILLSGVSRRSPPLESNFTCISHTASAPGQRAFMSFMTCPGQPRKHFRRLFGVAGSDAAVRAAKIVFSRAGVKRDQDCHVISPSHFTGGAPRRPPQ